MSDQPFTRCEREAWNAIGDAFETIVTLDERGRLRYNVEELAVACHTMQDFVKQHAMHRMWPEEFSDWYDPEPPDDHGSQG